MGRIRKTPQRTCVGCRTVRPKNQLVRIVRTPDGEVEVDPTGKKSGRGAYICPGSTCLEKAMKGRVLSSALQVNVTEEVLARLRHRLEGQS
jgi:predicted RNA-binding protein YlxR (DUF448 family)